MTLRSNISKTSARVLSGVPNTKKQMKSRGRRPTAFIVSRWNGTIKKYAMIYSFAIILPKWMNYNLCSDAILPFSVTLLQLTWLIVLCGPWCRPWMKMERQERELVEKAIPSSTKYKNKWALTIFGERQISLSVIASVLDPGGLFKGYDLHKVAQLFTSIGEMDAVTLNYWLSKFVMELAKKSGKRCPSKTVYGIICGIDALNSLDNSERRWDE